MKQKKWTSKEKLRIVLEGIKGQVSLLGVKQIFTSFCNPKGNADTERFFRTLKEDLIWPREFESYAELEESLRKWIRSYNEDFPHSAIGYQTPEQYEKNHTFNHQLNNKNILQVLP